jgi:integrase
LDVHHRGGFHRLTAAALKRNKIGIYADGGGLYLQITKAKNGGVNRSWLFRYKVGKDRDRWMGLGPTHTISLAEAREAALQCRKARLAGIDPIAQRAERRAAEAQASAKAITFAEAADGYVRAHAASWRNAKHSVQWPASLRKYVFPTLGPVPVSAIDTPLVLKCLRPLWERIPETANRIRGRVEAVLDWSGAAGYRQGENPARWGGLLEHLLPSPSKTKPAQHHAAMPVAELPAFMAELRAQQGTAARALEFAILTAARSAEIFGAHFNEIEGDIWTVPAKRMKAGREHQVPLARRATEIIEQMRAQRQGGLVFPGRDGSKPLGQTALRQVLKRLGRSDVTAHGFRSVFRDWCGDHTIFAREVAEAALAHAVGDKVEAAYRRGSALQKRAKLMEAWAQYLAAPIPARDGKVRVLRRGVS